MLPPSFFPSRISVRSASLAAAVLRGSVLPGAWEQKVANDVLRGPTPWRLHALSEAADEADEGGTSPPFGVAQWLDIDLLPAGSPGGCSRRSTLVNAGKTAW